MASKMCPDCSRQMTGIRMIDKAYRPLHGTLNYAAGDAKRGVWLGRFPIEGQIEGLMCEECGRVLLYAKPKEQ